MSKKIVIPGEFLGIVEEYSEGEGTFVENGKIFAKNLGTVDIDLDKKEIKVQPHNPPVRLKINDTVVGKVTDLREVGALIEIAHVIGKDRAVTLDNVGLVHISKVSNTYTENVKSAFGINDIVKACVTQANPLYLSTVSPDLGVLRAQCPICKTSLIKQERTLKCESCGRTELRKVSSEYGKILSELSRTAPIPMRAERSYRPRRGTSRGPPRGARRPRHRS